MSKRRKRVAPVAPDAKARDMKTKPTASSENKNLTGVYSALRFRHDRLSAAIFIFLIGLMPLIVRIKLIDFTAPRLIATYLDTGWHGAFFTYYKLLLAIIAAVVVIAILADKILIRGYHLPASYINVPALMLVLLVLISLLAAEYKSIALLGIYSQGDGAFMWLAWLALFLAAATTGYRPWFSRAVAGALLIVAIVNVCLLILDFTGIRILDFQLVQALVAPPELRELMDGNISSTLGNTNYISGLAAALFAFFMGGGLLHKERFRRRMAILAALICFVMVLASLSSSGFVTLVIIIPLLAMVVWRSADRGGSLKAAGAALGGCLIIFLLMNAYNPQVGKETIGFAQGLKPVVHQQKSGGEEALNLNRQGPASVQPENQELPAINPAAAEQFRLPQPGWAAGTGRIYIWQETGRLILDRPLTGYGPGTLAYYFPQNDVNKVANLHDYTTLETKPHNMYLGIAYGMGVPALLVFLVLLGLHAYYTGCLLWRGSLTEESAFPAALFLFFCAFAVQAVFNDAIIPVGTIFWILMGVGVSLNREGQRTSSLQIPIFKDRKTFFT